MNVICLKKIETAMIRVMQRVEMTIKGVGEHGGVDCRP